MPGRSGSVARLISRSIQVPQCRPRIPEGLLRNAPGRDRIRQMLFGPGVSIVDLTVGPLSIPLREPFVIASGRMDATRAALVRATLEDGSGRRATGFGESAALPPVT